jgi:hypothetical protein
MEYNCGTDVKHINSVAEEVLDIMEPASKGRWFDECQATTEHENKAIGKCNKGMAPEA